MADEPETEEQRKKRESYRSNIVKEIVSSEERYVAGLKTLVDVYSNPLQAAIKANQPVLTQDIYDSIFQNVNLICSFNEQLLHGLKNMEDPDQVGMIFQQFAPFLKMYTAYTDNSEKALQAVREELNRGKASPALLNMMSKNRNLNLSRIGIRQSFKDWCETGERVGKERLESLLIQPVQRVPRYRMLLAELLKFTHQNNKDYKRIESALAEVSVAATHCNEGLRARQRDQERAELHQRFPKQLKWTNQSLEARKIVMEEVMFKIDRKGTCRPNVVILFNDLLCYGKGTKGGEVDFSHVLDLKKMTVGNRAPFTDPKGNQYNFVFQVESPKKSFALAAKSEEERTSWVNAIRDAIGVGTIATKKAPIWEPDKKDCSVCGEEFSFFTGKRRHHCRNCGICVCASCSPFSIVLKYIGDVKPQRVCKRCYPQICFSERVERFYAKWDAKRLEEPGWLDGVVTENYGRKAEFMAELVARFGPEPGGIGPVEREQNARSMSVSQGSGMENVEALKSMAKNLQGEKQALVNIALADSSASDPGNEKPSTESESKTNAENRAEALAQTVEVDNVEDTLRWDERLWMFFRYYDRAELTADPHFVAKVLMQCPTATKRLQLMRGLEQKYGPESAAQENLVASVMNFGGDDDGPMAVAASDSESESDADEVDANIW